MVVGRTNLVLLRWCISPTMRCNGRRERRNLFYIHKKQVKGRQDGTLFSEKTKINVLWMPVLNVNWQIIEWKKGACSVTNFTQLSQQTTPKTTQALHCLSSEICILALCIKIWSWNRASRYDKKIYIIDSLLLLQVFMYVTSIHTIHLIIVISHKLCYYQASWRGICLGFMYVCSVLGSLYFTLQTNTKCYMPASFF